MGHIKALQAALSKSETPEAKSQRKRLAKAEKLWMQAVEDAGAKEMMKYFGADKEEEEEGSEDEKRTDAETVQDRESEVQFSLSQRSDFSEYEKPITAKDVETLRAIGRKSINAFTDAEIVTAQKWAHKFYKELGTKSPFFRAWFGDWRAFDKNKVSVIEAEIKEGKNPRGVYVNKDTGWKISSSSVGYDETISHSGKDKLSLHAMRNIDKIIENAVLLDTETSEYGRGKKSVYTAFMHKFYSLVKIGDKMCIAKMAVDESYSPGQDETNKKFYHVRSIEIETAPTVGIGESHTPIIADTVSDISISDLFAFVKAFDKEFSPKPVNELLLNEDGTPKVFYHGTNAEFTEFDLTKSGGNFGAVSEGMFFFTDKKAAYPGSAKDYAEYVTNKSGGKEKIYECYLRMQNPLILDSKNSYDPISYYDRNAGRIYEKYFDGDYDGIIVRDSTQKNSSSVLAMVDNSSQIKSATDNIGTFSGSNDIRFSLPAKPQSAGARAKSNANRSRSKTFTREDAALIAEAVVDESTVFAGEDGGIFKSRLRPKRRAPEWVLFFFWRRRSIVSLVHNILGGDSFAKLK